MVTTGNKLLWFHRRNSWYGKDHIKAKHHGFLPWCFAVRAAYSVVIIWPLILHAYRVWSFLFVSPTKLRPWHHDQRPSACRLRTRLGAGEVGSWREQRAWMAVFLMSKAQSKEYRKWARERPRRLCDCRVDPAVFARDRKSETVGEDANLTRWYICDIMNPRKAVL